MQVHGFIERGVIAVTIDGTLFHVPDDLANGHRQKIAEWEGEGNEIPPYARPPVTVEEVKAEARRRIEAIWPSWRQLNLQAEGGEAFIGMRSEIDAIRARSNEIEQMEPLPEDVCGDELWLT